MINNSEYQDDVELALGRLTRKLKKPKKPDAPGSGSHRSASYLKRENKTDLKKRSSKQPVPPPDDPPLSVTNMTVVPLPFTWVYWHDRPGRDHTAMIVKIGEHPNESKATEASGNQKLYPPPTEKTKRRPGWANMVDGSWGDRVTFETSDRQLAILQESIDNVRTFWNVFNNLSVNQFHMRDTVHLFRKGVLPIWEDKSNATGGAITFRITKKSSPEFWTYICLLAIGNVLSSAVQANPAAGSSVVDTVWGVSLTISKEDDLIWIWNANSTNADGVERLIETVFDEVKPSLRREILGSVYTPHWDRPGFKAPPKIVSFQKQAVEEKAAKRASAEAGKEA